MPDNQLVEILFRRYSEILEEETEEWISAEVSNEAFGYFILCDIPAYLPKIAFGDEIWAEYDNAAGAFVYRRTIQYSENSTIHAVLTSEQSSLQTLCDIFISLGCMVKEVNPKFFALNIPAAVNYFPIKDELEKLEKQEIIGYAESCLSEKHDYKNFYL